MGGGPSQRRTFSPSEIARYYSIRAPLVKQTGREWRGPCPIHQGTRFSFAVDPKTGLWICHSQCGRGGSIFELEMAISGFGFSRAATEVDHLIGWPTHGAQKGAGRIVDTYDYTDPSGNLIYQCVRYSPKNFKQRRPNGRGAWIWNLKGIETVLFRLPRVASAQTVLVAEGEKDVLKLESLGFTATCNPMGAKKWKDRYSDVLKGKDIVVFPDNDEAGRIHAEQVVKSLSPKARSIRVIAVPVGNDISDWVEAGATSEDIEAAIQHTRPTSGDQEKRTFASNPTAERETPSAHREYHSRESKLPSSVWTGLTEQYLSLVGPSTEAPAEYHLASFVSAFGCLVGRRAWVLNPHPLYPNFYIGLIGETGDARKSTAYQFALNLMRDVAEQVDANVKPLRGLASIEGLAVAMRGGDSARSYGILAIEDELRSLITKGQQKGVANLIPRLTELYNCPDSFEVNTRADRLLIHNPFLSILTSTTESWFQESITDSEILGGFINSICLPG